MKRSAEIEAIVRRVWDNVLRADVAALENLLVVGEPVRVILGADEEWLEGDHRQIAKMTARRSVEAGFERVEFHDLEGYEHGDAGWSAVQATLHRRTGAPLSIRNTMFLVLEAGQWRCAQIHTSMGVGNLETFGFEMSHSLADLVDALEPDHEASLSAMAGSSGTVTLVFTDIENSTQLSRLAGDARWSTEVHDHFALVRRLVEDGGGSVVKTLGDGTMSAFKSAAQAVSAAAAVQQAVADTGLRVRIGVHTGDAIGVEGDYFGVAVAKAARVASAGEGGQIMVSSTTRELVGSRGFTFGPRFVAELKGLDGTHDLYPLDWSA